MKATTKKTTDKTSGFICLDTIYMSEHERRRANASLRVADLISDLLLRAAADMRAIARYAEGAAVSSANAAKAMFAKPVKR